MFTLRYFIVMMSSKQVLHIGKSSVTSSTKKGWGGVNLRKINKFRCEVEEEDVKRLTKLREAVW